MGTVVQCTKLEYIGMDDQQKHCSIVILMYSVGSIEFLIKHCSIVILMYSVGSIEFLITL